MRSLSCRSLLPLLFPKQPKTRTLETQAQLDPRGHAANAKLRRRKRRCTGMLRTLFSWRRQRAHLVAFWRVELASIEFQSSLEDEAETTVGQTDAEGNLVNRNIPKRTTHALLCTHGAPRATFDVPLRRAVRSSEEKCGSIHATAPDVEQMPADNVGRRPCHGGLASCRLNPPNYISPSPRWMVFVMCSCPVSHVLSYHPMSRNKKNTAPAALPCPVQSVLLPADALPVPVRVHEGPRTSKNPIPPATNLVSRFGGSGNGLSHEPQQKL